MAVLSKSTLFPAHVVADMFNNVKGKSSLAKMAQANPVSFNGNQEFVFNFDNEVSVVGENGEKVHGGVSVTPVTIIPVKFEYGARVSDEFLYAAEEEQINILTQFAEGFAKKLARGFDIAAMHGVNPYTGTTSSVIGQNNFDSKVTQTVTYGTGTAEEDMEAAIALVEGSEEDVTGAILAPAMRSALAALKTTAGEKVYPELAWGSAPSTINGLDVDVNSTVNAASSTDKALVGDFNAFKWGYAKEIPVKVIEYGDPDNTGKDLAGSNQIYLRAEAYIGWGILKPEAFAFVK